MLHQAEDQRVISSTKAVEGVLAASANTTDVKASPNDEKELLPVEIPKTCALIALDDTLLLQGKAGKKLNLKLIDVLQRSGVKDIILLLNVVFYPVHKSYEKLGKYFESDQQQSSIPEIIKILKENGLTVHGVMTPWDYVNGVGVTYKKYFLPIYNQFWHQGKFIGADSHVFSKHIFSVYEKLQADDDKIKRKFFEKYKNGYPKNLSDISLDELYQYMLRLSKEGSMDRDELISWVKEQSLPKKFSRDDITNLYTFISGFLDTFWCLSFAQMGGIAETFFDKCREGSSVILFDSKEWDCYYVAQAHQSIEKNIRFQSERVTLKTDYEKCLIKFTGQPLQPSVLQAPVPKASVAQNQSATFKIRLPLPPKIKTSILPLQPLATLGEVDEPIAPARSAAHPRHSV